MGKIQDNFIKILSTTNYDITFGNLCYPDFYSIWNSKNKEEVMRVYIELGGVKEVFPSNLKKWDLEFDDIAIELDEFLHFNRYRKITLASPLYKQLSNFPLNKYIFYCENYENQCLKVGSYGGKWTNKSCEKQFGSPSEKGDLSGNGSPRWKQRAFYDFIKDLSPLLIDVPIVRISIWDEISLNNKNILIKDILDVCDYKATEQIINLINIRKPALTGN